VSLKFDDIAVLALRPTFGARRVQEHDSGPELRRGLAGVVQPAVGRNALPRAARHGFNKRALPGAGSTEQHDVQVLQMAQPSSQGLEALIHVSGDNAAERSLVTRVRRDNKSRGFELPELDTPCSS
jgi:hypothetical protein